METDVYADAGYGCIETRDGSDRVCWHVAMGPVRRRLLDLDDRVSCDLRPNSVRMEGRLRTGGRESDVTVWLYQNRSLKRNIAQLRPCLRLATSIWLANRYVRYDIQQSPGHMQWATRMIHIPAFRSKPMSYWTRQRRSQSVVRLSFVNARKF